MNTAPPSQHHELKYVMDGSRVEQIHGLLQKRCMPDPQYPAARVCSIYYDTLDWRYFDECTAGQFLKSKIRLRWYAHTASGTPFPDAFVERKSKEGARRAKLRVLLPGRATEIAGLHMTDPALREWPWRLREVGGDPPLDLLPVVRIEYMRRRFVDPRTGARLSIDSHIRVAAAHPRVGLARTHALPHAVLEHKSDRRALPPELEYLTSFGIRLGSFSKYSTCLSELVHGPLSPS